MRGVEEKERDKPDPVVCGPTRTTLDERKTINNLLSAYVAHPAIRYPRRSCAAMRPRSAAHVPALHCIFVTPRDLQRSRISTIVAIVGRRIHPTCWSLCDGKVHPRWGLASVKSVDRLEVAHIEERHAHAVTLV
jgi:hypothetical protein